MKNEVTENSIVSLYLGISVVLAFEQSSAENHSTAGWNWLDTAQEKSILFYLSFLLIFY